MKRRLSLFLAFTILLCICCACQGNFGSVDLNAPVAIPADGSIDASLVQQMKSETAIGVFSGNADGFRYEWTIFGSDITTTKAVNLGIRVEDTGDGTLRVILNQQEAFGFSALLSVYLNTVWDAQSATAYADDHAIASVSITGSKTTILNLMLDGTVSDLTVRPDPLPDDGTGENTGSESTKDPEETTKPQNGKDQYHTDPVPEGKPKPVEPENQDVNKGKTYTCTFSIECATILNNLDMLDPNKLEMVPSGGVILAQTTVTFYEGESVYEVLQRVCRENKIHMEAEWTPIYNSAYIEGIHNLYEFDCGALSGWMYRVNGWYPNYGCSRYQLQDGDVVEWRYTCDLGSDVGGAYAVGG